MGKRTGSRVLQNKLATFPHPFVYKFYPSTRANDRNSGRHTANEKVESEDCKSGPISGGRPKERNKLTRTNYNRIRLATITMMCGMAASSALAAGGEAAQGSRHDPLFLTITNAATNFLAVVNTRTREVDYVPTGGMGGAGGNAGGVAVNGKLAAAVNFRSSDVTIFVRKGNSMQPVQKVKTTSQPLSVAFGHDHLVVLGMTTAESFPVYGDTVGPNDGIVPLFKADGSAGQIVAFAGGVVYSEKSGSVAQIALSGGAAGLSGPSIPILLPAAPDNDTPYGLAARGANVYLSIAHSNLEALIVKGGIVSTAIGPLPFKNSSGALLHAPCWNTLAGQFLYSADSPGKQLLRYLVSDGHIFFDKGAAATFSGAPTDLDAQGGLLGAIDGGDGVNSNVSIFDLDGEGELTLRFALKIAGPINGAAILQ
jgi:hypothetical protein